jgi:stage V sporulation protein SpoVS
VLGGNLDLQTLNGKGSADWSGCGQLLIDQAVKALAVASRLSNGNSKPISVSA